MLLVDTGPLVAMADRRDRLHAPARDLIRNERGPLVTSAQITAEVDYLLRRRLGQHASHAFLTDLAAGRFRVECPTVEEVGAAARLSERYGDSSPSLADLSLVVLAERFDCVRVATFDERHFRAIRPLQGGSFAVLPADL